MVRLENISKKYVDFYAVENVSLDIKAGEFLTLLGPSGCGKTTTLRMIAGFEKPTTGTISIDGKKVNNIEPYHREVNTIFQSYSLFPHMNVFDNIAFGLKMKKVKKQEISDRVDRALKLVQLEGYKDRKTNQLSGGQQQRIAIARAIVNNPQVLLLDEPLEALDLKLRKQMQLELKHLQQSLGITFIYVTHDQEEALKMSDRIVVMNEGRIEQVDQPQKIYQSPQSLFVANFIGETNTLKGVVTTIEEEGMTIQFGDNSLIVPSDGKLQENDSVHVSIRPENITFTEMEESAFEVVIKDIIYIGSLTKVVAELSDGQEIIIQTTSGTKVEKNSTHFISWQKEKSLVYQAKDAKAVVQ